MAKYILITGAREYPDLELVENQIWGEFDPEEDCYLIEGEARGVDKHSADIAKKLGINVVAMPAQWKLYGRAAGPIRNREMVKLARHKAENGNEVICLAFPLKPRREGSGTWECIDRVKAAGLPIKVFAQEAAGKD